MKAKNGSSPSSPKLWAIVTDMEKIFDVKAIIIDKANNDKKTYFFVHNDTIANSMKIFQLKDGLIDENKEINPQLKDLFDKTPNYYIDISSDLLIKLVDQLGGIDVGGVHIDGNAAMKEVKNSHFDLVIDGIAKALGKKNLLLTVPSLVNTLKDTYKSDLNLMDAIKIFISEIGELNDWKIDLITVNSKDDIIF